MVFGYLLDNPRADIRCLQRILRSILALLAQTQLIVRYVFVNAGLFAQDSLNIDLFGLVTVLDQSFPDCIFHALRINWHNNIWWYQLGDHLVLLAFRLFFHYRRDSPTLDARMTQAALRSVSVALVRLQILVVLLSSVSQLRRVHIVCLCNHLSMYVGGWEPLNILVQLVTQRVRIPAEEGLRADNLHRHDRVHVVLELLSR